MDSIKSSATAPQPSTDSLGYPCACYSGLVYIGHLVEDPETGDEAEAVEAVPCRRCNPKR